MASTVIAQPEPRGYRRIAAPLHTVLVLAAQAVWAIRGMIRADQLRSMAHPNHMVMYSQTIFFEWFLFALVIVGLRLGGSPLSTVLGERWRSVPEVLRDIGIAMVFAFVSMMIVTTIGQVLGADGSGRRIQYLLPQGGLEMTLWMTVSISAGICEEAVFRGYLQKQFMALANNAPIGILLSAVAFGLAHAYQGWQWVILIGLEGVMLGSLAHWRRSLRPGMIAHASKDAFAPLLVGLVRH
jgi:membrane protease YdiL (CAAX protease family)